MNEPCFYIPKQLMTTEFSGFSVESKLLFGMILTNTTKARSISELADLIYKIDSKELKLMHNQVMQIKNEEVYSVNKAALVVDWSLR